MRVDPKQIIYRLRDNDDAVRKTARELGISPGTVVNWKRRAGTGLTRLSHKYSTKGLERRSTRPKSVRATTLSAEEQRRLVELKRRDGYGARKLSAIMELPYHHRTLHRYLKHKGLVVDQPNYRRPRLQETTHMHVRNVLAPGKLQMDVKYVTPELSGLVHTAYLYGVIDIFSRYKQGVILPDLDSGLAVDALVWCLDKLPFEADFVQTDNGTEFLGQFRTQVIELKLKHHYVHKKSPNENAVIERSFRTDEEEFFWLMGSSPDNLTELNQRYQVFLDKYNTYRPHQGLDYLTPLAKLQSVQ